MSLKDIKYRCPKCNSYVWRQVGIIDKKHLVLTENKLYQIFSGDWACTKCDWKGKSNELKYIK